MLVFNYFQLPKNCLIGYCPYCPFVYDTPPTVLIVEICGFRQKVHCKCCLVPNSFEFVSHYSKRMVTICKYYRTFLFIFFLALSGVSGELSWNAEQNECSKIIWWTQERKHSFTSGIYSAYKGLLLEGGLLRPPWKHMTLECYTVPFKKYACLTSSSINNLFR